MPRRPLTPPPPAAQSLERRIGAALTPDIVTASDDLALLITEVLAAIEAAAQSVERERSAALDLANSPDPTALLRAELSRDRLRAALPRLQRLLAEAEDREAAERWDAKYRRVESMVKEAARKFARYPQLLGELIELMTSTAEVDREVDQVNASAPAGELRRLYGVELSARNLNNFTADQPPIGRELKLPDWQHSGQLLWPLPQRLDPAFFAPPERGDPRLTSDSWWQVGDEQRVIEQARQEREAIEDEREKKGILRRQITSAE